MVKIFLLRHGQASFHAADYDQLSDAGHEQARLLGSWFADCGIPVHHMVAGGMRRHLQTAEGFFSGYSAAPDWQTRLQRDVGFNEFDHREILDRWRKAEEPKTAGKHSGFGGLTMEEFEIKMQSALSRWAGGQHDQDYAEPWPVFRERCVAALIAAARLAQPGQKVLAFTSCGTITALCRHILGFSVDEMVRMMWRVANGSITCFTYHEGRFGLQTFNATPHIDRSGRPELLTLK
jgi:broad specificity phosphatase PhoE